MTPLTFFDREAVEYTVRDLSEADVPKIIAIHEEALRKLYRIRETQRRDAGGVDRAIAMREHALKVIKERYGGGHENASHD